MAAAVWRERALDLGARDAAQETSANGHRAVGLALLAVLALAAAAVPVSARTGELQGVRAKAKALAADVAALDAQIDAAVQRRTRATDSLAAVRGQIGDNKRLQTLALRELDVARATLVARAVALYKHDDVTALDAILTADDFGDLVSRLTMVQSIARGDRDVLRTVERTKRELADRAVSLVADERTARKLVVQRDAELKSIKAQLGDRQAMLAGVRQEIRDLAARQKPATPTPGGTVKPPSGGGSGRRRPGPVVAADPAGRRRQRRQRARDVPPHDDRVRRLCIDRRPRRLLRPVPVPPRHLEGLLEPLSLGQHHRRRRTDPRHGARPQDGVRARLVGPVLLLGVLG